jgi:hypothetical protein
LQQSAFGEANEAPTVNAISAAIVKLVKSFFMTILLLIFFESMPGRSAEIKSGEHAGEGRDRSNRRYGYAVPPQKAVAQQRQTKSELGAAPEHRPQRWDSCSFPAAGKDNPARKSASAAWNEILAVINPPGLPVFSPEGCWARGSPLKS